MDVLEQEDNQFKYKLMNIFFQYIKHALFILLLGYEGSKLINIENDCNFSEISYVGILYHGGIILLFFNCISCAYILYQKHFVRIEYFITYGLNFLVFICMCLFSIQQLFQGKCQIAQLSVKCYLILSIITQLDVLMIMLFKHELSNRQTNICSNTTIVILLLITKIDDTCALNVMSLEIMLISANIFTLIVFTSLNVAIYLFPKLREQLTNAFKFVCVLVLCFLILNYLLLVYYVQQGDIRENQKCMNIDFIIKSYCYLAPVNMLGLIPILASFKFDQIDDDFPIENQLQL